MARWILFRDRGADRRPLEVAHCHAPTYPEAVAALAPFAGDVRKIAPRGAVQLPRDLPFFVQSLVSVQTLPTTWWTHPRGVP